MDPHDHDEPEHHEREARIAEQALALGDAPHARYHLANALFDTAGEDTHLDLARRVLEASSLDVLFAERDNSARTLLAKAVLLHLSARDAEGLRLLAGVAEYCAELRIERWLAPWVADAREPLASEGFYRYLLLPARSTIGRIRLRPAEIEHARCVASVVDALLTRPEILASATLLAIASGVYRRAGRLDDAIRTGDLSVAAGEGDFPLASLALARRAAGDFEGARRAFLRAMELDTNPRQAELGRVAWDAKQLTLAREHFEAAAEELAPCVEIDVCMEWLAHATAPWWRPHGAVEARGRDHEAQVGRALTPDDSLLLTIPWVGFLPEPADAIIKGLVHARDQGDPVVRSACSHLEAPSARLAFAWTTGARDAAAADVTTGRIPDDPDPRVPWTEVPFVLWRYEGDAPFAALPIPGADVLRTVETLARIPFYLPRWWEEAARLAPSIGPVRVRELAAAMTHALRTPPDGMAPWVWLQRQQVAAALLIARVEPRPTAEGVAWETLEAILCGPLDWAVEAAIIAASELALEYPHMEPLVRMTLDALIDHAPREGSACSIDALVRILPALPRAGEAVLARCADLAKTV